MKRRSAVAAGAWLKHFTKVAKHPWIASKIGKLQAEKWLFDWMHPNAKGGAAGKIKQVSIRITDVCNLRCIMCGQWGDKGFLQDADLKQLKRAEVKVDRYIDLMRDLVKNGHHPIVYLWGGEPTLYDGWLELIEECTRLKLPTAIATNGTNLVAPAERLVKAPMFLLQVSIDGHNAELHNKIRRGVGKTDSFASIQKGLEAVNEAKKAHKSDLPLIASLTTISRDNSTHLVDIYEHYRDKVDMFVFYPAWWIDEAEADRHAEDFKRRFGFEPKLHRGWVGGWTPDDYEALNEQIQELKRRSASWNSPPVTLIPDITGVEDLRRYYTDHTATFGFDHCISIFQVAEIDSNGAMSPCRDYHDYIVGNVKNNTITEIWNNERYRKFRGSLVTEGLMPVCTRCCGLMGY